MWFKQVEHVSAASSSLTSIDVPYVLDFFWLQTQSMAEVRIIFSQCLDSLTNPRSGKAAPQSACISTEIGGPISGPRTFPQEHPGLQGLAPDEFGAPAAKKPPTWRDFANDDIRIACMRESVHHAGCRSLRLQPMLRRILGSQGLENQKKIFCLFFLLFLLSFQFWLSFCLSCYCHFLFRFNIG